MLALDTQVQEAQASVPEDLNRILNTIAGRGAADLAKPADSANPNYEQLNDLLRCRFAAAALRPLLDAGRSPSACLERLSSGRMRMLELNFLDSDLCS